MIIHHSGEASAKLKTSRLPEEIQSPSSEPQTEGNCG